MKPELPKYGVMLIGGATLQIVRGTIQDAIAAAAVEGGSSASVPIYELKYVGRTLSSYKFIPAEEDTP